MNSGLLGIDYANKNAKLLVKQFFLLTLGKLPPFHHAGQ